MDPLFGASAEGRLGGLEALLKAESGFQHRIATIPLIVLCVASNMYFPWWLPDAPA
jgi:hypothetical protein